MQKMYHEESEKTRAIYMGNLVLDVSMLLSVRCNRAGGDSQITVKPGKLRTPKGL